MNDQTQMDAAPLSTPSPQVTVIIPTHNRADLLPTALTCALQQEDVAVEVIVIDDGSTDATPRVLDAIADPRLVVLRNDRACGVSAARNRGIEHARAPWIAFLDDDDLWAPHKLRVQLEAAAGKDSAVLVYAGAVAVDDQRCVHRVMPAPPDAAGLRWHLLGGNWIGSPSSVIARASALEAVGAFDERLSIIADWDLWIRLIAAGDAVACEELVVAYTEHPGNMHLDMDRMLREFARLRHKHRRLARAAGRGFGSRVWWRWVAAGYRRRGRRFRAAAAYLYSGVRHRSPRNLRFGAAMLLGPRVDPGPDFPEYATAVSPGWLDGHR